MGVRPRFTEGDVKAYLLQQKDRIYKAMLNRVIRVGEEFVNDARDSGQYRDQTGNLRSSIGYIILFNGRTVSTLFEGDKPEGQKKGEQVAKQIAGQYPKGFVLIVVAGMDYAAAVEARNYDVLTGSSLRASESLKRNLKALQQKRNLV